MRNQASGGEQGGPGGERWEQARRAKQASSRLSDYEGVILYGIEVLKPMQLNLRWVFFFLFWKQRKMMKSRGFKENWTLMNLLEA